MERYFDIHQDSCRISCKLFYNEQITITKTVLFCHDFAGHKDNAKAKAFSEYLLEKHPETAVLVFNLPAHGDDERKVIVLKDCITYMHIVLDYIRTELHTDQIYSYASSFGGYLVLKYISDCGNPFVKIALRCPAVNMAEVMTHTIMNDEELERVHTGENVPAGFDRKTEVNQQFLRDLEENDIRRNNFYDVAEKILIMHGTGDEVVPFEEGYQFAMEQGITFVAVEHADHRFRDPACLELATKTVVEFFQL